MIRVLHIMGCSDAGGISSVVLNYYRWIDRSRIHFDIGLTIPTVGRNGRALQELGAAVHFLPLKSEGLAAYEEALTILLKQENYDAVHVHDSETCYVTLRIARKAGIPCRVAHCHTTSPWEGMKGELRRLSGCLLNYHYATRVIGCGRLAGERVFGKYNMTRERAMVLPNAVDTRKFAYDAAVRQAVRRELGVEGKFVLGMVGRMSEEKNNGYALDLLPLVLETIPNAVLVAAGNGPDEEKFREKTRKLGLENQVWQLGRRDDVAQLYQAFDVYLLPSFTEGFPVAAVEAMAAGLPVLLSDVITRELEFGSAVRYLPLKAPELWCREAANWLQDEGRAHRYTEVEQNGLDIRQSARLLEQVYEQDVLGVKK